MASGARPSAWRVAVVALLAWSVVACTAPPTGGQPTAGDDPASAAQREGKVVVYSSTDSASAEPLLNDFKRLYPSVQVEYNDLNSTELYNRFTSEAGAGAESADLLWSSAMDLQLKLVIDGRAMSYASPEIPGLPEWAVFRNQAYGTTLEPFVIAYNQRLLPADAVPQSHDDLARVLREKQDVLRGKVTAYDPEKSGLGFLVMTQDQKAYPGFWDLAAGFGSNQINLYTSTGTMIEKISSGEHLLGYDIIGSYVLARMKKDPSIAMVYPRDFTVAFSRIAFIADKAPHPNAAKLFLDYLLSKRGQDVMANQSLLHAIRGDVEGEATAAALAKDLGPALRPIPVTADLVQGLEAATRQEFFNRWTQSTSRG